MAAIPTSSLLQSEKLRLCEIGTGPLEPSRFLAAIADPAAGGHDLFIGTVRREADGRDVGQLEYTAHPTSQAALEEVALEVIAHHDLVALAVGHRVGLLEIGDIAVVCAVSAAHRQEAFTACRELIDSLKARVPIWKNEHYLDGTSLWVGAAGV
jgi:molybdopterin synthase catalytic subunit